MSVNVVIQFRDISANLQVFYFIDEEEIISWVKYMDMPVCPQQIRT